MLDVSHAKFISSYHSASEETEVPDLYYRYSQQYVNVYSQREENRLISKVTTTDLDTIADEQQLEIQNVLEATFRKKPILVIVTTTGKSTDDFGKPRIYVFWHWILEKDTKMVHFDLPMVGDLSVIAMTSQPLVLIHQSTKEIKKEQHVRHLIAFGKRGQSVQIALLDYAELSDKRIRGQVTDVELPGESRGDVTAIHVLPQCTKTSRLGYGDPRIFVGTSKGYIHVLRFKTQIKKQTRNGIHVEPGYTWNEMMVHGNAPITYLACKRAVENYKVMAAVAQGQKDDSMHDDTNDNNDDSNENDNDKITSGPSLWMIEWLGNFHRKTLGMLAPQKLTSFTLSSIRIIPASKNYQVTAIFQSTQDKQHFEIGIWTIEKGVAKLVLSDEIFECDKTGAPQDIWPIHLTSKYMLLAHDCDPIEIDTFNTNSAASPKTLETDELLPEYEKDQPLNDNESDDSNHIDESTDSTSTQTQHDDEQDNIATIKSSNDDIDNNETTHSDSVQTQHDDEQDNIATIKSNDHDVDNNETTHSDSAQTQSDDEQDNIATMKSSNDDIDNNEATHPNSAHTQHSDEQHDVTTMKPSYDDTDINQMIDSNSSHTQHDDEHATSPLSLQPEHNVTTMKLSYDDTDINQMIDSNSAHTQHDDEQHNITTAKLSNSTMTIENISSSSIMDVAIESAEEEIATDVEDSMKTIDNDNHISTDTSSPIRQNGYEGRTSTNANDGLLDAYYRNHGKHLWQKDDTMVRLGTIDTGYNNGDVSNSYDNNDAMETNNLGIGSNSHDDYTSFTTHDSNKLSISNRKRSFTADDDDTSIADNDILDFIDDINHNILATSNDTTTSIVNEPFTAEQNFQRSISTLTTPTISKNNERSLDNTTTHICKSESDVTDLEHSNIHSGTTSEPTPLFATSTEFMDIKPLSSPPVGCQFNKENEAPTATMMYKAKIKDVAEISFADGLEMVRNDEAAELDRRERLCILFDIIFMNTTITSATTKTLDTDKVMEILESLPLDAMEQDWLMNYCFTHKNPLLKLFIMRYNIKHGNLGLVLMQQETMKTTENSGDDENSSGTVNGDVERTCNNLTKLCWDMVPSVLQDLPLEIFGQARGKVGNPFLNKQNPSLLQEKGLGLGGELLAQVIGNRKRRRLDRL